jgi:membrane-associated protease RseP (regulator of RpoE activity)
MRKITLAFKSLTLITVLLGSINLFAQSRASYTVSFTSTWDTETNDPINGNSTTALPNNAHWSDLVGATHNSSSRLLEMGSLASLGVKNVAEFGSNGQIMSEVQTLINAGNADQFLQAGFDDFAARTTATLTNIEVSEDFPLLSLVSMIAPSPDWMIAVDGINLRDGNAWVNELIIPLFAYDSGTDSGMSYTAPNQATTPNFEPISILINEGPFNAKPIGTLTITFNETLNVDVQNITEVSLYPNPSKGDMTIKTPNSNILDQAQVYDILGKQVANFKNSTSNNELQMDLTHLNNGIYLVRLILIDGSQSTKKVVIN